MCAAKHSLAFSVVRAARRCRPVSSVLSRRVSRRKRIIL